MRPAAVRFGWIASLGLALGLPAAAQLQMPAHCRPPVAAPPMAPLPAAPPVPVARSLFEDTWDWSAGARNLTFCIDNGTPAMIAAAVQSAAMDLSASGFGWMLQMMNPCVMGWDLNKPVAGQQRIRVRVADLGLVATVPRDTDETTPYDEDSDNYRAMPGGNNGSNRPGGFAVPPLAYFQPGPYIPLTQEIQAGEIVFNWRPPMGMPMAPDPKWNTAVGTPTFDPREVAMHEFGHAIRMKHDDFAFDDDRRICPEGSSPGANALIVERGLDNVLQTRIRPDDRPIPKVGDLDAGADGNANSGKKTNVMETLAVLGRHTINPRLGFPMNSDYSYTEREQATGQAASRHRP